MKKLLFILTLLAAFSLPATAVNFPFQEWCQKGGNVITAGLASDNQAALMYPHCVVTVFLTNTSTLANIFSSPSGGAISNPLTANADGSFIFYAAGGHYDVVLSGGDLGGFPLPYTYSDVILTDVATSGGTITLQTNGVNNGSQVLLNLQQGSNVTLSDNGSGTVTINASGGGGGGVTGSGTASFLPIWTSATNLANSPMFDTGTAIGVGRNSLTFPVGNSSITDTLNAGVVGNITIQPAAATVASSGGNVFINGTQPGAVAASGGSVALNGGTAGSLGGNGGSISILAGGTNNAGATGGAVTIATGSAPSGTVADMDFQVGNGVNGHMILRSTASDTFYVQLSKTGIGGTPQIHISAGAPTMNCPVGSIDLNGSAATPSTALYVCQPANTWTAVPTTGGGGSGTVTSVSCGTGLTCSPNPIVAAGTASLVIPVTIANGGTNGTTQQTAVNNLLPSCALNQIIQWNGANWVCVAPAAGSVTGAGTLSFLTQWTGGSSLGNSLLDDGVTLANTLWDAHTNGIASAVLNVGRTGNKSVYVTGVNAPGEYMTLEQALLDTTCYATGPQTQGCRAFTDAPERFDYNPGASSRYYEIKLGRGTDTSNGLLERTTVPIVANSDRFTGSGRTSTPTPSGSTGTIISACDGESGLCGGQYFVKQSPFLSVPVTTGTPAGTIADATLFIKWRVVSDALFSFETTPTANDNQWATGCNVARSTGTGTTCASQVVPVGTYITDAAGTHCGGGNPCTYVAVKTGTASLLGPAGSFTFCSGVNCTFLDGTVTWENVGFVAAGQSYSAPTLGRLQTEASKVAGDWAQELSTNCGGTCVGKQLQLAAPTTQAWKTCANSTAYSRGSFVTNGTGHLFRAVNEGTSGTCAMPSTAGAQTLDGTIYFQEVDNSLTNYAPFLGYLPYVGTSQDSETLQSTAGCLGTVNIGWIVACQPGSAYNYNVAHPVANLSPQASLVEETAPLTVLGATKDTGSSPSANFDSSFDNMSLDANNIASICAMNTMSQENSGYWDGQCNDGYSVFGLWRAPYSQNSKFLNFQFSNRNNGAPYHTQMGPGCVVMDNSQGGEAIRFGEDSTITPYNAPPGILPCSQTGGPSVYSFGSQDLALDKFHVEGATGTQQNDGVGIIGSGTLKNSFFIGKLTGSIFTNSLLHAFSSTNMGFANLLPAGSVCTFQDDTITAGTGNFNSNNSQCVTGSTTILMGGSDTNGFRTRIYTSPANLGGLFQVEQPIDMFKQAAPSLSQTGACRFYMDSGTNLVQFSCNGGAFNFNVLSSNTSTTTTQAMFATAIAGVWNTRAITAGDLPSSGLANVVYNNAVNTGTTAMTLNMSASTTANAFQLPSLAGCTSGADGAMCYDPTGKLTHQRTNSADSISAATTTTTTTTTFPLYGTAVAGIYAPRATTAADLPSIPLNQVVTPTGAITTIALGTNSLPLTTAQTADSTSGLGMTESSANTSGTVTSGFANQSDVSVTGLAGSTSTPFSVTQGSVSGATAFPLAQFRTTWNNASTVFEGITIQLTNTASSANSHLVGIQSPPGTTIAFVDPNGDFRTSGVFGTTSNSTGGIFTAGTGTTAQGVSSTGANVTIHGLDNSSSNASSNAGPTDIRSGALTNATPANTQKPGLLQLVQMMVKGTTITAAGDVLIADTTNWTVTDAAITPSVNIVGIACNTTNPIGVIMEGVAPVVTDNVAAVGNNVCAPTVTAGKGHAQTGICAAGTPTIGVVVDIGANSTSLNSCSGTGLSAVTLSTTLPAVMLHIANK